MYCQYFNSNSKIKDIHVWKYWLQLDDFQEILNQSWTTVVPQTDSAKIVTAKFEKLRKGLKEKQARMSSLKAVIASTKFLI